MRSHRSGRPFQHRFFVSPHRSFPRLLSRARATLVAKYGVEPVSPTYVEIFAEQKDFGVRTFGIPDNPGFLGVCFGRVVTANGPAATRGRDSNWEAVLWHEFTHLSGRPLGVLLALIAASTWALGTQLLRRPKMPVPTLAISFWMTAMTAVVMTVLAVVFERHRWVAPSSTHWGSIVFNAVLVFGFAHAAWFYLARSLPPVASTLSVMLIPVVGVFSGSLVLGEVLHWQDWAAVVLMVVSIAAVLWPARQPT